MQKEILFCGPAQGEREHTNFVYSAASQECARPGLGERERRKVDGRYGEGRREEARNSVRRWAADRAECGGAKEECASCVAGAVAKLTQVPKNVANAGMCAGKIIGK